jgi:hypothetical protein
MIRPKQPHYELQYRPQAAKTLRQALVTFITREFPRLGGPWVVDMFVDKLLELVSAYYVARDALTPGQTIWPAVAVDERPGYHKPMTRTRQVPVVLTVTSQDDVANLRSGLKHSEVLKRALVRVAKEAYAQGGVLTCTDLGMLFHHSPNRVAELIRQYEDETGEIVPRRGNVHDIGRTVTHKRIICRKAYLEGKPTHVIARETNHSPEAVDHYVLGLARVHFAVCQRGLTVEEAAFATQQPVGIVQQYIRLIEELALNTQQVYARNNAQLSTCETNTTQNERREQESNTG